jgi:hypothetical protein
MKELLPLTSRLLRDDSAVASIMLAGTMLMTFATTGLAVDFGRALFTKIELQQALDAGGLAGGDVHFSGATAMSTQATEYFGANWGAPFGSHIVGILPTYTPKADTSSMTGFVEANVPTTMLWAIGQTTLQVTASNLVDTPVQSGGMEVAMVLDNTGSEATGCKMQYLIQAAQGMINELYNVPNPTTTNVISVNCSGSYANASYTYNAADAPTATPPDLWISIVPFVTEVNPLQPSTAVGSDMQNWITNGWIDTAHATDYPTTDPWAGCVEARLYSVPGDGTNDAYGGEDAVTGTISGNTVYGTELPPSTAPFTRYFWPSDTDIAPNPLNPNDGTNFKTGGEPNAPWWPAFNLWKPSTGTFGWPEDKVTGDNTAILASVQFTTRSKVAVAANCAGTAPNGSTVEKIITPSGASVNAGTACKLSAATSGTKVATDYSSSLTTSTSDVNAGPDWNSGTTGNPVGVFSNLGPNLGCITPMTVMSTNHKALMQNLALMYPDNEGGTATNLGLAWGWRVLSPNWQGVWNAGATSGFTNQPLPLPYNYIGTDPTTQARITMQKVVIFMTDGNNNFFNGDGTNGYTAYKTLDHTPLLDQTPAWTAATNKAGKTIPAAQTSLSGMATRESNAQTSLTNKAWAICDAMQDEGIIMYTILLEYNLSDISTANATGYQTHCATDTGSGTHFWELTGTNVNQLGSVFTAISASLSELRLAR